MGILEVVAEVERGAEFEVNVFSRLGVFFTRGVYPAQRQLERIQKPQVVHCFVVLYNKC
jgi:hypothetical protein